jgi:hypothetical protein
MFRANFLLGLVLSTSSISAEFLEDSNPFGRKVPIDLASLDVNFGVKIADVNFFDGLRLSARYSYEVEPSYQGGYYTRIDKYDLKAGISPGDFFEHEDIPVYLSIERGSEVIFVRQFQSQAAALTSIPVFDPRRIPFNSRLALQHMKPGDFVSIPARMNIVVGVNGSYPIIPGIDASAGFNAAIVSGKFQLHAFRMPNNKVRLRLITDHGKGVSFHAGIRTKFDIFGIKIADRLARNLTRADLPKLTHSRNWGNLVLLDYVYDLAKPEVREAYDRVLKSTFRFRFRDLAVMDDLRDKLVSDLFSTEKIRLEDMNLPPESQRVRRLFSGDDKYRSWSTRMKVGTSFIKFEWGAGRAENRVTYYDRFDVPKVYSYMTAVTNVEAGIIWSIIKYDQTLTYSSLVSFPDPTKTTSLMENLNLSFEVKDKYISRRQRDSLLARLNRYTDGRIFSPTLFDSWKKMESVRNGRFIVDLWITKQGLREIEGLSQQEIYDRFLRYLDGVQPERVMSAQMRGEQRNEKVDYKVFHQYRIWKASELLEQILNPKLDGAERGRAYISLKGNSPFEDYGTGFLIHQLKPSTLNRSLLARIRADGSGVDPIRESFGTAENLDLLNSLQYMQYVLGNGYFDPRWDPIPNPGQRDDEPVIEFPNPRAMLN